MDEMQKDAPGLMAGQAIRSLGMRYTGGAEPPDNRFTHRSDSIDKLAMALAKAQGEFPVIPRDRTVRVKTRTGGEYTFSYAPLETLIACTRPALSKHGLAVVQERVGMAVRTVLLHESGQWMASHGTPILKMEEGPQADGSALTYAKRYDYSTMLLLAADEDDDANAAMGNAAEKKDKAPAKPKEQVKVVTAEQAAFMEKELERVGLTRTAFCRKYGIPGVQLLPAAMLHDATLAIEEYASKKKEKQS